MRTSAPSPVASPLTWAGALRLRRRTDYIVVHHSGADPAQTRESIHEHHRRLGWAGYGYHYHIGLSGVVEGGRPVDTVGAHVRGYNDRSVGVLVTGNLDLAPPTPAQLTALAALLADLEIRYPRARVVGHRELAATACPGRHLAAWLAARPRRPAVAAAPVSPAVLLAGLGLLAAWRVLR